MRGLANKVALITGGASGLGQAAAIRLAEEGAIVIISDVDQEKGAKTASEHGLHFLEQDVSNEVRWRQIISEIEQQWGRLEILVNNAGIIGDPAAVSPEDTSLDNWRRTFAVNVESVFLGCRSAIPAMRRGGSGSIVNISSVAGILASPYNTAYGASKAAVRQLTKSVAQHCAEAKLQVRCNSVHPGIVMTPLWEKLAQDKAKRSGRSTDWIVAEAKARCPMGDFTRAEDVAAAVAFLASEESRHITGSTIIVDGGIVNCDTFKADRERGGQEF